MSGKKKIIVMFPTPMEGRVFVERYGAMCETVEAGVGLTECAARTAKVIVERKPDLLILAGFAGAHPANRFGKGDTVLVERENSADLGSLNSGSFRPLASSGDDPAKNYYICSNDIPDIFPKAVSDSVNTAGSGNRNEMLADADIENMEGASFFAVCNALGVEYLELRTISNTIGESPEQWDFKGSAERLAESLKKLLDKFTIN